MPDNDEPSLDLTIIEPSGPDLPAARPQEETPRDRREDKARIILAAGLVGLLGLVIVLAFLSYGLDWTSQDELEGLVGVVFGPVATLAGTALGFYFYSRRDR